MKTFEQINPHIAHITHYIDGVIVGYFQELNEAGDDWDEQATRTVYENYLGL